MSIIEAIGRSSRTNTLKIKPRIESPAVFCKKNSLKMAQMNSNVIQVSQVKN